MQILTGKIVSGSSNASIWLNKFQDKYEQKLQMKIFPGSLNISLKENFEFDKIKDLIHFKSEEYGGERDILLIKCTVFLQDQKNERAAYLWRTENTEYKGIGWKKNIVEIVTDVKLRDHFNLKDGDSISIKI